MKKNCPYLPKRSHILILAVALSSASAFAAPGYELYLKDNQLRISNTGASTTFNQLVGISSAGVVETIADVPSTAGVGIPSFTFEILKAGINPPQGVYQFEVAVVIDDKNSKRQMEAYIGNLQLTVAANGTISGKIPSQTMVLKGRDGSGAIQVTVSVPNAGDNGPVKVSGGVVTFDATALLDKLKSNPTFANVILEEFDDPATYDFRIVAKQANPASFAFGTYVGSSFTAFPLYNNATATKAKFVLGTAAESMASPYSVSGTFNVVYVAPSTGTGGSGGGTTDGITGSGDLGNTADQLLDQLNSSSGPLGIDIINGINSAIDSGATISKNIADNAATLQTSVALATFTNINKSLAAAGTAVSKGGDVNTTAAVDTINNLAKALENIGSRNLSATEVTEVNNLASSTINSAANLVSAGASTESILSIVSASSNILAQASKASGNAVSNEVVAQVKALAGKAVTGVIKNLPAAATAGVDLGNATAVKALMQSNPSILDVALKASAALPGNARIQVGNVSFTRDQLVAQSLAAGGNQNSLQGGFNFQAASTGFTVTTDSVTGNMTLSNGAEKYVAASPVSRLVPDSVPDGINYLPNGTAVLTGSGVATQLAPTAFDSAGFKTAVTNAGFQLTYRDNGTISIALANNERFSAAFGYDNLGAATSCGAISIVAPTGNPAAPGYAFSVKCANGPTQRVTPIADNAAFYTAVANAGLNASTDRNTGVVTIKTVGSFKPSFFVTPLSVNDTAYLNTNKNAEGIAFRAKDANGDGKTDYEVISSTGVQLLYGQ